MIKKLLVAILMSLLVFGNFTEYCFAEEEDKIVEAQDDLMDISGIVIWNDNDNQDGIRPSEYTVTLFGDDEVVGSVLLNEDNNWVYEFNNLNKYNDGNEINYYISAQDVLGYSVEVDEFVVFNTHDAELIDLSGKIIWNDNDNELELRPELLSVNLLANGEVINYVDVDETNNWEYVFEGLNKYENGELVNYEIELVEIDNYEFSLDGFNLVGNCIENINKEEVEYNLVVKDKDGNDLYLARFVNNELAEEENLTERTFVVFNDGFKNILHEKVVEGLPLGDIEFTLNDDEEFEVSEIAVAYEALDHLLIIKDEREIKGVSNEPKSDGASRDVLEPVVVEEKAVEVKEINQVVANYNFVAPTSEINEEVKVDETKVVKVEETKAEEVEEVLEVTKTIDENNDNDKDEEKEIKGAFVEVEPKRPNVLRRNKITFYGSGLVVLAAFGLIVYLKNKMIK